MSTKSAALCIIGSELVRGIINDSHAQTIGADLTRLGYEMRKILIIPDDGGIPESLEQLSREADLVITTGGLGPTSDDITRDAVAQVYQAPLEIDEQAKKVLSERVGARLNGANIRQVMIPRGFTVLENPVGTAPGFSLPGKFYALPGPPREMQRMWNRIVMPDLVSRQKRTVDLKRLEASVFLVPESVLEEVCSEAVEKVALRNGLEESRRPVWGTRVQLYRISLYLQGSNEEIRQEVFTELQDMLGEQLIVSGDVQAVDILRQRLIDDKLMIAGAESCTGGLAAKLLTDAPGSSEYMWGSLVTYANDAKQNVLSVDQQILEEYGAVSAACAQAMADGVLSLSQADVSFSITGIAGPGGGSEEKPAGTVFMGFASAHGLPAQQIKLSFNAYSRDSVRRRSSVAACLLVEQYLSGRKLLDIISRWQYS
jgi:nicotinamide-nucleotide amidase